ADVGLDHERLPPEGLNLGCNGLGRLDRAYVIDHHIRAGRSKTPDDGSSNAAGAARHNGGLAGQIHTCPPHQMLSPPPLCLRGCLCITHAAKWSSTGATRFPWLGDGPLTCKPM